MEATDPGFREPAMQLKNVRKEFYSKKSNAIRGVDVAVAVDDVSLEIYPGESLGLVGESGSGKSTVGRLMLRLLDPTKGQIYLSGNDITKFSRRKMRRLRGQVQAVFQDISGSLNPKITIGKLLAEPLEFHGTLNKSEREIRVRELIELVGLSVHHLARYPYELSGGQRQRVSIARALATQPKVLVLDEPVSALDVSTQSQVVNLLQELQNKLKVACLFIAHDLFVVHHVCNRIAVMYLGSIIEIGSAEQVYSSPRHPYTQALISAIPHPNPTIELNRKRIVLEGEIPTPTNIPSGCRFHTRCPYVMDICKTVEPALEAYEDGGRVACHLHVEGPKLGGKSVDSLRDSLVG